jgi:von Willebrand factor type A C-terminal domain/von Willebrand factor type A domain
VLTFSLASFANEHLPEGGRHLDAVITVTAAGEQGTPASGDRPTELAEVMLIDASGSMDGRKIRQARRAAAVVLEALPDGTRFAALQCTTQARMVYPAVPGLVVLDRRTRVEAARALRGIRSGGGTAIGPWLRTAAGLLRDAAGARHVTLLTDGRNQDETRDQLAGAVEEVVGTFQCDCRGVGADWSVEELRLISTRLMGTVDIVADPDHLVEDFAAVAARLVGLRSARVDLRLWTPAGVQVELLQQVAPEVVDLHIARPDPDGGPRAVDYATGAWGAQLRSYQLRLGLPPGGLDEEMLAARVSLVVDGVVGPQVLLRATWTDDLELSTRMDAYVAHYTGQTEMSVAVRRGLAARRDGELQVAAAELAHAQALAAATGNADMVAMLDRLVEVEDPATGKVRIRPDASAIDEMTLDTRSTRTTGIQVRPNRPGPT